VDRARAGDRLQRPELQDRCDAAPQGAPLMANAIAEIVPHLAAATRQAPGPASEGAARIFATLGGREQGGGGADQGADRDAGDENQDAARPLRGQGRPVRWRRKWSPVRRFGQQGTIDSRALTAEDWAGKGHDGTLPRFDW
jgi:hypothetical protein